MTYSKYSDELIQNLSVPNPLSIYTSILNKRRSEYLKNEILRKVAELVSDDYGIRSRELIDTAIDEVLTYIDTVLPEVRVTLTSDEAAKYMKELERTYREVKQKLHEVSINITSSIVTTLIRTGKVQLYTIDEINIQKFIKILIESALSASLNQAFATYLQFKKRERIK